MPFIDEIREARARLPQLGLIGRDREYEDALVGLTEGERALASYFYNLERFGTIPAYPTAVQNIPPLHLILATRLARNTLHAANVIGMIEDSGNG